MEQLGTVNQRAVFYQRCTMSTNWAREFPKNNWLLLVYADGRPKMLLDEIAAKAIDNNACYVCCTGPQGEELFNILDKEIDFREEDEGEHYMPEHFINMGWHIDIKVAFPSVFFEATNEEVNIDTVFFLDASTDGIKFELDDFLSLDNSSRSKVRWRETLKNFWSTFSAKP
jgi:hypothetical protein